MEIEKRRELGGRRVYLLTTALALAVVLTALDSEVVGAATPTIVGGLGGLSLYSWLVAAYLLTSTTTVPAYGWLSDVYGRKGVFLFGVAAFTLGSALCALAASMPQLIVFRALQGLGAGAVLPTALTIAGDTFPIEQRARVEGLFSTIWGVCAVLGPPLGGLIVAALSWHWIFLVNVPIGLLALLLVVAVYHEQVEGRARALDLLGLALFTGGVTTVLVGLEQIGQPDPMPAGTLAALFASGTALLVTFVWWEARTADPIVPLSLLCRPVVGVGYLVGFFAGVTQYGLGTYLPLFVQGAAAGTALLVGAVLAPMAVGWSVGSVLSGKLMVHGGFRAVLGAGMLAMTVGSFLLLLIWIETPLAVVAAIGAVSGVGMGLGSTTLIVAVQDVVEWHQRGVATALNQFTRNTGGTFGVAIVGALLNSSLAIQLARAPVLSGQATPPGLLNMLLDPSARVTLPEPVAQALRIALLASLREVFVAAGIASLLGLLVTLAFYPRARLRGVNLPDERGLGAGEREVVVGRHRAGDRLRPPGRAQ